MGVPPIPIIVTLLVGLGFLGFGLRRTLFTHCACCRTWVLPWFAFCPSCGETLDAKEHEDTSKGAENRHDDETFLAPSQALVRPLCPACWQPVRWSDSYCGYCGEPIQKRRETR